MTTSEYLGLRLPAPEDYYSLENHWNWNSLKIDEYAASLTGATGVVTQLQSAVQALAGGVHLKGAVNYFSNLPSGASEGDAYTVLYAGTTGTDPLGVEYAWADYNDTLQWVPIGVDPTVFARQADLTALQTALNEEATTRGGADTKQVTALAQLIDGSGKKNLCPTNSGSSTPPTRWLQINFPTPLPAGQYEISIGTLTTDDTDATTCQMSLFDADNNALQWVNLSPGQNRAAAMTIAAPGTYLRIYPSDSYAHSEGDTVTVSDLMICTKAFWDISQSYVPYSS